MATLLSEPPLGVARGRKKLRKVMPVQIGAKVHHFTDPTGLLSDCHRRIEMFLGVLQGVAEVIDRPPSEETRSALESALRYFGQAAPKHTADEEESLFPRLRQVRSADITEALSQMEKLEHEHSMAAPLHARAEELGLAYLANGSLTAPEAREFRQSVASLAEMYRQHIRLEDDVVFPLAARVLPEREKAAIAQEMAKRREAPLVIERPGGCDDAGEQGAIRKRRSN